MVEKKYQQTKINKYIFFFFSLFFYIDILHFPTIVGTEGRFIACER